MQLPVALPRRVVGIGGPRWGAVLVALLAVALAAAAYALLAPRTPSVPGTQVAVRRGSVSQTLTTNGTSVSNQQAKLSFSTSGRINDVFVKLGDSVVAGQPLATLDARQLEIKLDSARSAVRTAELKLQQLKEGVTREEVAAAQAVVDQAAAKLSQAQAGGRPEEITAARAQAAQAQARTSQVAGGARPQELTGLQAVIDQAGSQREQVRVQLGAAQAVLDEARYRVAQAGAGQGGPGVRPEDIVQAEASLEASRLKLAQIKSPRAEDVREAELAVAKARSDLATAQGNRDSCGDARTTTTAKGTDRGPLGTDRTTIRSTAKTSCPDDQHKALEAQVDAARTGVQMADNSLQKVRSPSPYDVQQAEQTVNIAEANLKKLKFGGATDLAALELKVKQSQAEVDRFEAALDGASASMAAALAKLDAAANPDQSDVRQAVEAANQARANLAKAVNPDPYLIETAQAGLAQAQAELGNTTRGPKETELALALEQVEMANQNVRQAELDLEHAVLTAPFDGIVAGISAHAGEQSTAGVAGAGLPAGEPTALLTLVDPREVRVEANIDEVDVGKLAVGKTADVVFDALPERTFGGQVTAISPSGTNQQGVVKYLVSVRIQVPPGVTLPSGLTTSLILQKQDALLVPRSALRRQGREQAVEVTVGGSSESRTVRTGLAGDQFVEIVEGLNEGDVVVVSGSGSTASRVTQAGR